MLLSPGERALWFLHRLAPGSAAYNLAGAIRIARLEPEALHRAMVRLVERHSALRMTFPAEHGEPFRRVHAWLEPEIVDEEVARLDVGTLRERCEAEALRPFDPEHGPLLRVRIFRDGDRCGDGAGNGDGAALFVFHHLVADFWSLTIFLRELGDLYGEETGGAPAELLPPPPSYEQWVERQGMQLSGARGRELHAFWMQRLAGPVPVLDLPADRPRPAQPSGAGVSGSGRLGAADSARLQAFARARGATLFAAVLAGYQLLLHRITGDEEVWVGVPAAGRGPSRWARTVGYFVNPVVLRGRTPDAASFDELLGHARSESEEALAHRDWPFPWLAEELHPVREFGRTPLFQAMLVLYRTRYPEEEPLALLALGQGGGAARLGGLELETLPLRRRGAQLDISLTAALVGGELRFRLELDADRFDAATAQRIVESFETLLAGGLADPLRRLSELPLLREAQRHQILEWGEGAPVRPADLPVHDRIWQQAAATPDAPAVLFEGRLALTWRELRRRSLELARALRARGAAPGAVVGISLDRSPDLVVAVLGTLAAGAAYLPLDPAYPQDYLAYVVNDSGVSIILSSGSPLPLTGPGEGAAPLAGPPLPLEAWAYVLYTSGSLGKPKATPVTHRALLNYLEWALDEPLAGIDGVLFLTSLNFDASLKQLFAPLLLGRPVHLLSDESARQPERLLDRLGDSRSGRLALNCVPSLWRAALDLLEAGSAPACERIPALARLLLGGEGFDRDLVDRTLRLLPGLDIWNLYGPTESTANASAARLEGDDRSSPGIGRPIRGARLHVIDPLLHLVPPGAIGELAIGGAGVAPGYWKQPEQTAERFIPDPFADLSDSREPGARLFRTGDLARWRPDGSLELLGRIDRQLKIRGLRIEPGEVEAVLSSHPAVAECVVGTGPASSVLVAWVVPRSGATLTATELRRYLEKLLPASLVPSLFVILGAMPRLPNGKVSHASLPAPEAPVPRAAAAVPRSQAEEMLASLWCEVLRVPQIGIHDDFFDRGGHSLLATRLLARVRTVFGVDLPLGSLFAAPTVARLSEVLAAARRETFEPPDAGLPVEPVPRTGPMPLSFAQERLWFIDQWSPGNPAYNIPAAVRLRGALDVGSLGAALAEIVRRHEALRTTFSAADGCPVQNIHPDSKIVLPVVDLESLAAEGGSAVEETWRALAREEARRGFDLHRGPLLRTTLLRLGAADHVLVVNLHHIVSDGWSMGVLIEELRALYAAFHEGQPSPLPALPVQYVDFSAWQRRLAAGEGLARDLEWWRSSLAGAPAALELPADRPRPPWFIHRGGIEPVALPPALTARLRELARREDVTLFMILLAAFELLLARLAGVDDLVVGTAVAQRTPEVEELIGLFVNLLALRGDLSGDPALTRLLARTRSVTLEAHDHQQVPFEKLVAVLDPTRDSGRHPLFQVALTLQSSPRPATILPGLELHIEQLDTGAARFDLTLFFHEKDGGLAGVLEHSADLFDRTTMRRLLTALESLLAEIVEEPTRPVSHHSCMSTAERHQILWEWNAGPVGPAPETLLHRRFESWAARRPETSAVSCEGEVLTYGALNRRANRWARHLRALGVGPETRVAICLDRSVEMVVALLAVLKAGGAYVPLDPGAPRERLLALLDDAAAVALIARDEVSGWLARPGMAAVDLGRDAAGGQSEEDLVDDGPEAADLLAYVIFTSGSTGRPKGVEVSHGQVARLLTSTEPWFDFGPDDVWTLFHSFAFDFSVWEIWGALAHGGRLVVVPYWVSRSPQAFLELLARERVTVLNQTPSAFAQLTRADEAAGGAALALRQVVFGGEALDLSILRSWIARRGDRRPRLVNMYGITETTVHVTYRLLRAADLVESHRSPLGVPIPDLRVILLDRSGGLVPAGAPGEIHVGGRGVARGYLNRPDLTADRFTPDPWGGAGERLYRSGDLARHRPGGELEYLGRIDYQIKIRGFRIEPAEIEAALVRHPAVREAVVLARGGRLVAYATASSAEGLRDWLAARLPDYMIPATFVVLDALPLTANGKVDRGALPEPDRGRQDHFIAPRTPVEEHVAAVWAEVLGVAPVGAEDDFFELGGHSLLATQIVSRLSRDFGVELGLRAFFDTPTVAGVALAITREQMRREDPQRIADLLARAQDLSPEELEKLLREEGRELTS